MHSDGGSWLRCSRCATPSKADINQTTADFTGRESDACHELPGNRRTEPKCDLCQDRGPFRLFMSLPNYHPDRTRLCWHMPGVCVSQAQSSRKACQVVASCVAAGTVTARASQARVAKTDMAIREGAAAGSMLSTNMRLQERLIGGWRGVLMSRQGCCSSGQHGHHPG
ncbi:unnamed protein product [Effrenium voratum]|nr:unnamed protein product [Effrenium voratum]